MALVRVYCGLASVNGVASAPAARPALAMAVVDDTGRLLDLCEINDDPAGFAELNKLLAARTTGPYSVAIATDRDDRMVTTLLTVAGWALGFAGEAATDDFAARYADKLAEEIDSPETQRRAVGLARALHAGVLSATLRPVPGDLVGLKPLLAAHGALSTGRHGAATALREVLRELYPAALRAYADPSAPVPLAVLEALPEPGKLTPSAGGQGRDAAATVDAITATIATSGVGDRATVAEAVTALRAAITETPRGGGADRAAASAVAEVVRQAVAAVRACDTAGAVLVDALAERVTASVPQQRSPERATETATPASSGTARTAAPAAMNAAPNAGQPHRTRAARRAAERAAAPASAPPVAPAPLRRPDPRPAGPEPTAPLPVAPAPVNPAPAAAAAPATHDWSVASAPPAQSPEIVSVPPAHGRPVSAPPPPPPGIAPIAEPRPPRRARRSSPQPAAHTTNGSDSFNHVPPPRSSPEGPPPGSRAEWPTTPPADDWAAQPTDSGRIPPPWQSDDLQPPEPPPLRLVEPALPEELRGDLGWREPPPLRLVEAPGNGTPLNGTPLSAPPVEAGADDDDLLIFAQTCSAWFVSHSGARSWESAMDEGWRAAEQASQPSIDARTDAGLPRRVPHANLVPGSAPQPSERPLRIVRDPSSIAASTSGFFNGWRRGGQEIGGFPLGGRTSRQTGGAWDFRRDEDREYGT